LAELAAQRSPLRLAEIDEESTIGARGAKVRAKKAAPRTARRS
jgi:hypothetical protein